MFYHAAVVDGFGTECLPDHVKAKIVNGIAREERRAKERQTEARTLCEGCHRPPILCVCQALPSAKLDTQTTFLILQHPNEFRKKTFSTVPFLSLVLENVHIKVGYEFSVQSLPMVEDALRRGEQPLLLFPSDQAISLDQLPPIPDPASKRSIIDNPNETWNSNGNLIVVLDGTWAEAKRMALKSPDLVEQLQHVTFSADAPSLYDAVRKEPEAHCYSTLEACARALVLLENGWEESQYLIHVLELMVQTKLELNLHRPDDPRQKGRKRHYRIRQRERVERALFLQPRPRVSDSTGTVLRLLTINDATAIFNNWYNQSVKLSTIEKRIELGVACFGIEQKGKLVAHIVRCEDGCLGMLHVDEEMRGRGYGTLLLEEATLVLDKAGLPKIALIKRGNTAAETVFRGVGWTVADDTAIQHEGFQRRRWYLR